MGIVDYVIGRLRVLDASLAGHASYRVVRHSYQQLNARDGQRIAAAVTYFAVFSIFPFILLLISLLSFAIDSRDAQQQVIDLLSGFLPIGATGVQEVIDGVIAARGAAAGLGILLLLWGALGWFESIDQGVNEMWDVKEARPFFIGKLFALGMIGAVGAVMALSWLAGIVVGIVSGLVPSVAGMPPGLLELVISIVSFGLIFLVFLLLYRYSPRCQLSWRDVWLGSLLTAVLWTVVRSAFTIYVTRFADFSSAYGPFAAIIAFLVWLYVTHLVILFGASLTYALRVESQGGDVDGRRAAS